MSVPSPGRLTRVAVTGASLAVAGTYLAARIDFVRRYRPNMPVDRYWIPQLTQVWLPGLGIALALSVIATVFHVRRR